MTDTAILGLLKSGKHHQAVQKLYRYFPVVKKMVLKNNGTTMDAEDIYQEALIILFRKVAENEFELKSSINTYLYSVCRNLWHDELRKKGRQWKTEYPAKMNPAEEQDLKELLEKENLFRQAEWAVLQLGEKCRALLQLFYFQQLSMIEIARRLNFSSEKVAKNQKYRCIEKAKENLSLMSK